MKRERNFLGVMRDSSTLTVYHIYVDDNLFAIIPSDKHDQQFAAHSLERYFKFFLNPNKFPIYFPENYVTA